MTTRSAPAVQRHLRNATCLSRVALAACVLVAGRSPALARTPLQDCPVTPQPGIVPTAAAQVTFGASPLFCVPNVPPPAGCAVQEPYGVTTLSFDVQGLDPSVYAFVQIKVGASIFRALAVLPDGSVAGTASNGCGVGIRTATPRTFTLYAATDATSNPVRLERLAEVTVRTTEPQGVLDSDPCIRADFGPDGEYCNPLLRWESFQLPAGERIQITVQPAGSFERPWVCNQPANAPGSKLATGIRIGTEPMTFRMYRMLPGTCSEPSPPHSLLATHVVDSLPPGAIVCPVDGEPMRVPEENDALGVIVNELLSAAPNPERFRDLAEHLRDAGVSNARRVLDWNVIQPTQGGAYQWEKPDSLYRECMEAGIEPWSFLAFTPRWASSAPPEITDVNVYREYPPLPEFLDEWLAFVRAAVDRYGPASGFAAHERHWEVWNEPEFKFEVAGSVYESDGRVQTFVELHNATYAAIKSADPSAIVWGANFVATPFTPPARYGAEWLAYFLDRAELDGFALHVFYREDSLELLYHAVRYMRTRLDTHARAELHGLELGVTSVGYLLGGESGACSFNAHLTPEEQAAFLRDVAACITNAGADRLSFYKATDVIQPAGVCPGSTPECRIDGNGFLTHDLGPAFGYHNPKPFHYAVLQQIGAWLTR